MNCTACGHESREGAKFCGGCARPLDNTCPACAATNPPEAMFCDQCAASLSRATPERDPRAYTPKHLADKILQSKSTIEGERKQVTVLFADVKVSMELQEGMDPEEWHGIMDHFL